MRKIHFSKKKIGEIITVVIAIMLLYAGASYGKRTIAPANESVDPCTESIGTEKCPESEKESEDYLPMDYSTGKNLGNSMSYFPTYGLKLDTAVPYEQESLLAEYDAEADACNPYETEKVPFKVTGISIETDSNDVTKTYRIHIECETETKKYLDSKGNVIKDMSCIYVPNFFLADYYTGQVITGNGEWNMEYSGNNYTIVNEQTVQSVNGEWNVSAEDTTVLKRPYYETIDIDVMVPTEYDGLILFSNSVDSVTQDKKYYEAYEEGRMIYVLEQEASNPKYIDIAGM